MILGNRRVRIGSVLLDSLDPRIVLLGMDPGQAKQNITAADRGPWGQRMTGAHWGIREASITFALDISKKKAADRLEVLNKIYAWAKPKQWLRFSMMDDRQLYVDQVELPNMGDFRDWTNEYTILFRAYNVPFWESREVTTAPVLKNKSSGSVTIEVGGTAPSVLDISFKNTSGKQINDFSVTAGGKTMKLTGANITASETLTIGRSRSTGAVSIKSGTRNVYNTLTGADDLRVDPGKVTVTISATRAGNLTVTNYARWI